MGAHHVSKSGRVAVTLAHWQHLQSGGGTLAVVSTDWSAARLGGGIASVANVTAGLQTCDRDTLHGSQIFHTFRSSWTTRGPSEAIEANIKESDSPRDPFSSAETSHVALPYRPIESGVIADNVSSTVDEVKRCWILSAITRPFLIEKCNFFFCFRCTP